MRLPILSATVLVTGALLGGCKSHAEIKAAALAEDEVTCRAMGFEPGTSEFKNCRLTSFQAREDRNAKIRAAIWSQPVFPVGSPFNPLTVNLTRY
jgi:hypothetical protein